MKFRGKHTSMIREKKLVHRGGGMMVSGIPCLGTGAANHERELLSCRRRQRGFGRVRAAAGDARHTGA